MLSDFVFYVGCIGIVFFIIGMIDLLALYYSDNKDSDIDSSMYAVLVCNTILAVLFGSVYFITLIRG